MSDGEGFPALDLPVRPPLPAMEALSVPDIPSGDGWLYEPKWDGFRCLAFRHVDVVALQSKSGQPLTRYFPEVVEALRALLPTTFVLDGELVVSVEGEPSFDALLQRIHPAESRVRRLARETPARLLVFDLLVDARGTSLLDRPLADRRAALERFMAGIDGTVALSPASPDRGRAEQWMRELGTVGLDGVVAKRLDEPYRSGERTMRKIKRIRTADCVVGGFRYAEDGSGIGSLLLGLYDDDGRLDHVGFAASFTAAERRDLRAVVEPLARAEGDDGAPFGFSGRAPGGPSRWSTKRSGEWQPIRATLVCEVRYDHFSGGRFRHGTKLLRWRPDKAPRQCTLDQVVPRAPAARRRAG